MAGLNIVLQLFTFHDYRKQEKQQQTTEREERQQQEEEESVSNRLIYDTLHQPILYTGAVFLLLYVGTEVCIGNWGYTFLLSRNSDAVAMARIMAGYWGGICAGRLTLGWLTLKWGEKRMIYGYVCVLIGMLLLLYLVPFVSVNATGKSGYTG
jgi:fucose permease